MSPEYAVHGQYSIKSDVFSFGVLILEIVSGKKNRGFCHPEHHLNLLGHVSMNITFFINSNSLSKVKGMFHCSSTHEIIFLICFRHGDYGLKIGRLN